MEAKHTPGPWIIQTHSNGFIDIVADVQIMDGLKSWQGIATMNESDDVARADSRLIAAAPDLLALLVESQDSIGGDWRARRDAAISRATGEQDTGRKV